MKVKYGNKKVKQARETRYITQGQRTFDSDSSFWGRRAFIKPHEISGSGRLLYCKLGRIQMIEHFLIVYIFRCPKKNVSLASMRRHGTVRYGRLVEHFDNKPSESDRTEMRKGRGGGKKLTKRGRCGVCCLIRTDSTRNKQHH